MLYVKTYILHLPPLFDSPILLFIMPKNKSRRPLCVVIYPQKKANSRAAAPAACAGTVRHVYLCDTSCKIRACLSARPSACRETRPCHSGERPKGTCVAAGRRPYKQFAVLIRRAGCPHPAAQNAKAPAISGGLRAGHPTRCKDMPL